MHIALDGIIYTILPNNKPGLLMRVGISVLSAVIFLAITVTAVFLVYQAGVPVIQKMQAAAAVDRMKGVFSELDDIIKQTASEGKGSKRTFHMRIDPGRVIINQTEDAIYWELETDAEVVSSRASQRIGNMIIGANMETRVYEANYTYSSPETECYVIENEHLVAYFKKIGSPTSYASFSSSDLLVAIYNKDMKRWLNNTGFLDISIDFNTSSKTGNGYTSPSELGYNLPYGSVYALMNSSYIQYYINFTLQSGADFIEIEAST
jgi:hypothetical protein